ncbi:MAG TPA: hypothetical protein VGJ44_03215 [Kribbellaceae bacterium]
MSTPERPDSDIDRILRNAGAAWRADQPAAPQPDLSRLEPPRRPARRWVPALAAAAVGVIALGAITVARTGSPEPVVTGPATATTGAAALVVHDGDTVEAVGRVIAAPGKPVVFCPDLPGPSVGYLPGHEPAPTCPDQYAIPVTGVDLTELSSPRTVKGVTEGGATLRGIWRDRSIEVQQQSAPKQRRAPALVNDVPCPEPSGGWTSGAWGDAGEQGQAMTQYVDSHPDQFGFVRTAYPNGTPPTPGAGEPLTEVFVVGVYSGDLEQARAKLESLYEGNLCVTTAKVSETQLRGAQEALQPWFQHKRGLISSGTAGEKVDVELLVVDEALYRDVQRIGTDLLNLEPAIRPVS